MEEEGGVTAPVRRLRQRLSIDQSDDTKSPSAPSTPTKKRTTRLAAKPQLELIDENAVQSSPKRTTRKSIAKDITEAEEKPATPARRNTRAKSNTSLVLEADDKPITPSRRSTRIKSNTSLILDVTNVESPRAKRATRRNSQAGSDTELSLTPARTRRTRKDSASSIDIQGTPSVNETTVTPGKTRRTRKGSTSSFDNSAEAVATDIPTSLITEVIAEEPEEKHRKSVSSEDIINNNEKDSPTLRKSPRLSAKKDKRSSRKSEQASENQTLLEKEQNDEGAKANDESSQESKVSSETISQSDALDTSSANLIRELDTKLKKRITNKNKSASDIESLDSKSKRHRTKSWTTLCATPPHEGIFFSDNESTKKKLKKRGKIFNDKRLSETGSGDGNQEIFQQRKEDTKTEFNTSKKGRKSSNSSFSINEENISKIRKDSILTPNLDDSTNTKSNEADISNESNKENRMNLSAINKDKSATELLFQKAPSEIKSLVFIEDSDSNTESLGNQETHKQDNEDQCVPVLQLPTQSTASNKSDIVQNIFTVTKEENSPNESCEPMDVDVTIPENMSLSAFIAENKLNNTQGNQSRKSSIMIQEADSPSNKKINNSKRKSSVSQQPSQNLENSKAEDKSLSAVDISKNELVKDKSQIKQSRKSSISIQEADSICNENSKSARRKSLSHYISQDLGKNNNESKSTLVLSLLKDVSAADNSACKSPKTSNELSKSIVDAKDSPVNKNLTLTYTTSTPVQQKHVEKLAIQMNTSVITPTNKNKNKSKNSLLLNLQTAINTTSNEDSLHDSKLKGKNKKMVDNSKDKNSSLTKSSVNESSEDSDEGASEEELSRDKSDLLHDEAEDAGMDYESGDSQNEEERRYEQENEIIDNGETLTSEEELSYDSDYEKDSFIVSSDPEDNELLSGSGDDLDLSDNELTMTSKSKKKYNERKQKEQKQASREMFEARHGSKSSQKGKKSASIKKSRLDSTLLESGDEEIQAPPKKNKRMRIESTMESSQGQSDLEDTENNKDVSNISRDEEVKHIKKKSKRLSESICSESILNEKEITIVGNDAIDNQDPLLIKLKTEPKTPQKELDISTVNFTLREKLEEVHVDENVSVLNSNETCDPLQATMQSGDSDDASISENEAIANNYESMLKELNKGKNKPKKSLNASLNLNKKTKKAKEPIVDQLNLTEIKDKNKTMIPNEKSVKRVFKRLADDGDESDTIDLKLLYSEDSSGSNRDNEKNEEEKNQEEYFIPLKKCEAKTDILRGTAMNGIGRDNHGQNNNVDTTKVNKLKSSKKEDSLATDVDDVNGLQFFIDTKGDLSGNENNSDSDDPPIEVYFSKKSSSKNTPADNKNNKKRQSDSRPMEKHLSNEASLIKMSADAKQNSESTADEKLQLQEIAPKTPKSQKKKKKLSETLIEESTKTPTTEKKNINLSESNINDVPLIKTPTSTKKLKKMLESKEETVEGNHISSSIKTPASQKKKSESQLEEIPTHETSVNTPMSKKKTNKVCESHTEEISISGSKTSDSNKKKKKLLESHKDDVLAAETKSGTTSGIQKDSSEPCNQVTGEKGGMGNKKRKRSAANESISEDVKNKASLDLNDCLTSNKKKKMKFSKGIENEDAHIQDIEVKISKKRKERDDDEISNISKIPRLPSSVINLLEDKPKPENHNLKKTTMTSTSDFIVEDTVKRKNKPSTFLEETVYLNDTEDDRVEKKKVSVKKPKVLPFLPTVSTSDSGFTTKFQVNIIPSQQNLKVEFVAQRSDATNFKAEYLHNNKVKKLRTYDTYKKHRNLKLSKY